MNSHMSLQSSSLCETFFTCWAYKWTLSSMKLVMFFQSTFLTKGSPTYITDINFNRRKLWILNLLKITNSMRSFINI
ncbi:hypothetical protein X975_13755, partial [Stegodyphus mimosarum]